MSDTKREEIKSRIAAAQAREAALAERTPGERAVAAASEAGEAFTGFVRKHPLAAAAGGVVVGVLIASMFKGPRRAAVRGGTKAIGLATLGAEAASAFASELFDDAKVVARDAARAGAEKAEDLGDAVSDGARAARREVGYRASRTADIARIASRETGKRIARAIARRG
ncbi:MAG: hypothetical protein KDE15_08965 [Erythrobacter sp.]|nr:hypothetical protein [Erythrobacter sp.]